METAWQITIIDEIVSEYKLSKEGQRILFNAKGKDITAKDKEAFGNEVLELFKRAKEEFEKCHTIQRRQMHAHENEDREKEAGDNLTKAAAFWTKIGAYSIKLDHLEKTDQEGRTDFRGAVEALVRYGHKQSVAEKYEELLYQMPKERLAQIMLLSKAANNKPAP